MYNRMFLLVAALLAGVCGVNLCQPAMADGLIIIERPGDLPPDVRPHHGHRWAPLTVKQHHVTTTIDGQVAVTKVDQTFFNPTRRQLEGTYIFPIPEGAQIDRFTMDINGEQVEAELLDADKARKIYEDIVRSMRDPALLEYVGQGMFKVRIFPIEPRSDKHVTLKYTQLLESDAGQVEYRYPLNTEKYSSRPIESLSMKVKLSTKQPLQTVYCPSHEVEISRPDDTTAVIGFERSNVLPDSDFQLVYSSASTDDPIGLSVLTHRESPGEDGFFVLMASPQHSIDDDEVSAKDIIFVVDTSGSMAGGKLNQAQKALQFCLENLNDNDRFEIVRFSTESEALFGELRDVSDESKKVASEFIDDFKPIGGTAINSALLTAVKSMTGSDGEGRPSMVVFLTDGRPTVGPTDRNAIVEAVEKAVGDRTVRVFCFGIGTDINTKLLDGVAKTTRATTEYVLPDQDIEVEVSRFYTKVDSPVLANPELRVGGNVKLSNVHPQNLPDLFKGDQVLVFGRYSGSGDVAVKVRGSVNGESRTIVHEATFADQNDDNDFIPRLWATRRIGYLLEQIRINGESDELKDEVTRLARQYTIVTPYTAYLIMEDEQRRNVTLDGRLFSTASEAPEFAWQVERDASDFVEAESGQRGVAASRQTDAMQSASRAPASGGAGGMAGRASIAGEVVRTRFVDGRAFYRNGDVWIDSTIPTDEDARDAITVHNIEFGSDEYFDLLSQHPKAAAWLSIGQNVNVHIGDAIYEIRAPEDDDEDDSDG